MLLLGLLLSRACHMLSAADLTRPDLQSARSSGRTSWCLWGGGGRRRRLPLPPLPAAQGLSQGAQPLQHPPTPLGEAMAAGRRWRGGRGGSSSLRAVHLARAACQPTSDSSWRQYSSNASS